MIGKMAIATALRGFYDLHFILPLHFFAETGFIYNDVHIVQNWTKTEREEKKIKICVHGKSNPAILRLQVAWSYGR